MFLRARANRAWAFKNTTMLSLAETETELKLLQMLLPLELASKVTKAAFII